MKRVAGVMLLALGCTSGEVKELDPACVQEDRVAEVDLDGDGPSVAFLGGVRLLERRDRETGATQGTLGATFYDVRDFSTEYPQPLELSRTCVGITGMPVQTGTRAPLAVSSVVVDGVHQGPVTLSPDGGPLSFGPVTQLYADGPVTVRINGADGGFGSAEFSALTPPAAINVTSPDLSGGHSIGDEALELHWEPSGSDAPMGIDLVVTTSGGDRVVVSCVVKDDGCHRLESGPLTWLTQGRSDPITVFLRRSVAESRMLESDVDGGMGASVQLTVETRGKVQP